MRRRFDCFAAWVTEATGSPYATLLALGVVLAWFVAGFWVGFDNELYQLLINTGTTIVTFLMVFLIQNSSNRDAKALHQKLDELIRSSAARDDLIGIERPDKE